MSEQKKTETTAAAETAQPGRPMDDAEAEKIVGGTDDTYSQEQYDTWEQQFAQGQGQGEGQGE